MLNIEKADMKLSMHIHMMFYFGTYIKCKKSLHRKRSVKKLSRVFDQLPVKPTPHSVAQETCESGLILTYNYMNIATSP